MPYFLKLATLMSNKDKMCCKLDVLKNHFIFKTWNKDNNIFEFDSELLVLQGNTGESSF